LCRPAIRAGVTDKPRAAVWQARLFTPKKLLLKCFVLALALSTAPSAHAVDRRFDCSGTAGSLLTASCWSGNVLPGVNDTAYVGHSLVGFDAIGTTDVVRLSVVSAVPVPGAVWLFGSGLLGLMGLARRRKY
jgi:hypothetical protein